MKTPLALIHIGIDDCDNGHSQLAHKIAKRVVRLLRSYDLIANLGRGMFLLALPGCNGPNAVMLAELLYADVFHLPVSLGDRQTCVSACFGVVSGSGRSPLVVMREAELALQRARANGPGSVEFSTEATDGDPSAFLCSNLPSEILCR